MGGRGGGGETQWEQANSWLRILWEGPEEGANQSSRRVRPAGRPIGKERQKDGGAGEGRKLDKGVS